MKTAEFSVTSGSDVQIDLGFLHACWLVSEPDRTSAAVRSEPGARASPADLISPKKDTANPIVKMTENTNVRKWCVRACMESQLF